MNKLAIFGIALAATTVVTLTVKNTIDSYYLTKAVGDLIKYLQQQQVDDVFATIIEDLDDPED